MGETIDKFLDYLKIPNEHNLFMDETDPDKVSKYLSSFDMKRLMISVASPQNVLR